MQRSTDDLSIARYQLSQASSIQGLQHDILVSVIHSYVLWNLSNRPIDLVKTYKLFGLRRMVVFAWLENDNLWNYGILSNFLPLIPRKPCWFNRILWALPIQYRLCPQRRHPQKMIQLLLGYWPQQTRQLLSQTWLLPKSSESYKVRDWKTDAFLIANVRQITLHFNAHIMYYQVRWVESMPLPRRTMGRYFWPDPMMGRSIYGMVGHWIITNHCKFSTKPRIASWIFSFFRNMLFGPAPSTGSCAVMICAKESWRMIKWVVPLLQWRQPKLLAVIRVWLFLVWRIPLYASWTQRPENSSTLIRETTLLLNIKPM